ncbi:MAG: peptidylprolyl isomerase, partial [Pseudomonadota bacterium]
MFIKSRIFLASTACLLALGACKAKEAEKPATPAPAAASTSASPSSEVVAAKVNGTNISQNRVDLMLKQRGAQGQPDTPETRKAIVDHLALQLIISQEAVKKGLDKTPEVVDQLDLTKQSILANAFVQDYIKSN